MKRTKAAGRPRRYTAAQEKKIVNTYKRLRESENVAPTLLNLRSALERFPTLQPQPKSKVRLNAHFRLFCICVRAFKVCVAPLQSTYSAILRRAGLFLRRLQRGALLDSPTCSRRFASARTLKRRTKRFWMEKVLFMDIKFWSIRSSAFQKRFNRQLNQRGVFRSNQEACEPFATGPHVKRNRPGSKALAVVCVVGGGSIHAFGELSSPYKAKDVAKWVTQDLKPALEARGIDDSWVLRTDKDKAFTEAEGPAAFKSLPCRWEVASGRMQDCMPHDFSIWKEINQRMLKEEAGWSRRRFQRTEGKRAWFRRLKATTLGFSSDYIRNVCGDVYRRVREIYDKKGKRPRD